MWAGKQEVAPCGWGGLNGGAGEESGVSGGAGQRRQALPLPASPVQACQASIGAQARAGERLQL